MRSRSDRNVGGDPGQGSLRQLGKDFTWLRSGNGKVRRLA
jgi:hypothetical protein